MNGVYLSIRTLMEQLFMNESFNGNFEKDIFKEDGSTVTYGEYFDILKWRMKDHLLKLNIFDGDYKLFVEELSLNPEWFFWDKEFSERNKDYIIEEDKIKEALIRIIDEDFTLDLFAGWFHSNDWVDMKIDGNTKSLFFIQLRQGYDSLTKSLNEFNKFKL